jgi:hypothetical protein
MSTNAEHSRHEDGPTDEGEVLEWTTHPMKRKPVITVLVSLFIMVVTIGVYYWTESNWLAVFALVVLLASLARFFFPTSYRLSDRRITVKTLTQTLHKDWSVYRSCYPDRNGILLSPFLVPSRLENFRGLYLIFSDNRDEVTGFVQERVKRARRAGSSSSKEGSESA